MHARFQHYLFGGFVLFLQSAPWFGYTALFLGVMIEGDVVLFTASFFAREGVFNPFLLFAVAYAGVVIGDILWYKLGKRLAASKKLLHRFFINLTEASDGHLKERPFRTICISKFAYGIHHLLLMRAGAIGIPLERFIRDDMAASFVWAAVVYTLGYFSSYSFALARHYFRFAEVMLLAAIIILLFAERIVRKLFRKEL